MQRLKEKENAEGHIQREPRQGWVGCQQSSSAPALLGAAGYGTERNPLESLQLFSIPPIRVWECRWSPDATITTMSPFGLPHLSQKRRRQERSTSHHLTLKLNLGKPPGTNCPCVQGLGMSQAEYPQDPRQDLRSLMCLHFIVSNEVHVCKEGPFL